MAVTFAQLGIPFPLFAAPIDETTDYVGAKVCKLCGILQPHTFRVDAVMIPCSSCNSINADAPKTLSGEDILPGFILDLATIW